MVEPVNLNVPGLPYLLLALAFFTVVAFLSGVLSPIELAIWRHHRSDEKDGEGAGENEGEKENGHAKVEGEDRWRNPITEDTPASSTSQTATIYECRRCGTTLEAGDGHCPRCETASIARYEIG